MALTESDTRAQYIDPALAKSGWEGYLVRREFQITAGRIIGAGKRAEPSIADYLLEYKKYSSFQLCNNSKLLLFL